MFLFDYFFHFENIFPLFIFYCLFINIFFVEMFMYNILLPFTVNWIVHESICWICQPNGWKNLWTIKILKHKIFNRNHLFSFLHIFCERKTLIELSKMAIYLAHFIEFYKYLYQPMIHSDKKFINFKGLKSKILCWI